jgi:hypothetical protein
MFDFMAEAELFPGKVGRSKNAGSRYRRFDRASEAIRFAIEELPHAILLSTTLEIGENRYGAKEIRALYDLEGFPLRRHSSQ